MPGGLRVKIVIVVTLLAAVAVTVAVLRPWMLSSHPSAKIDTFSILSGSENKSLEPILQRFAAERGVDLQMHYKGSVDIMRTLQEGARNYDAVWPANSLWIRLGDTQRRVKHSLSIMTSPVVFGIRRSKAKALGFTDRDVYVKDILEKITAKELSFMMTSATQSNSGASSYIGFLYALLGNPAMITMEDLQRREFKADLRRLLAGVNRSSGSSGWLKDLFIQGHYDAMVNYEAMLIETNRALEAQKREPLYAVYPKDGLSMADSPLGYLNHGDVDKEAFFQALQRYLLSAEVQAQLSAFGRRTGLGAMLAQPNPEVFKKAWGIDTERVLSYIKMPSAEVLFAALNLYQSELRKPSLTLFALDYSGSMKDDGEAALEAAMQTLLDQKKAARHLLQATSEDYVYVLPFNHEVLDVYQGGVEAFPQILAKIKTHEAFGGTDIYLPTMRALALLEQHPNLQDYVPAVILMTDGASETDQRTPFETRYRRSGLDVPVFAIRFGSANPRQLERIADLTHARVFEGKHDLIKAFRQAKGYN